MAAAVPRPPGTPSTTATSGSALSNTTLAVFMSTLDGSIVIISLPAIFRGIHLDPLAPGNIGYLLWMIMGYRLVQAVFVVTLRPLRRHVRPGEDLQRRLHGLHVASILLSFDPFQASHGALWLIGWRVLAGDRRVDADRQLGRDPDRRLPRRPARSGARASTRSPRSPASSSGSSPAACWPRSTGGPSSGSTCRSASSARSGRTASCATTASATAAGSTGGATSRSRSGSARADRHHQRDPVRTAGTRWAGPIPRCSALLIGGVVLLAAFAVIERRVAAADVPTRPVPDPRLHRRQRRRRCRRRSHAAGCSSCSSSGCRASGCRCTATTSADTRCGRASSCCRSLPAS